MTSHTLRLSIHQKTELVSFVKDGAERWLEHLKDKTRGCNVQNIKSQDRQGFADFIVCGKYVN